MKSIYKSISDHVLDLSYEDTAVSMNRLTDCTSLSYIRSTLFTVYNGFTVGGLTKGHAGTNTTGVWIELVPFVSV